MTSRRLWLLRLVAFLLFAGHCWSHLAGKMPLTALVWDEALVSGVVSSWFGMEWAVWVSEPLVLERIEMLGHAFGGLYGLCAVFCLLPRWDRVGRIFWAMGAVGLVFLSWLKFRDAGAGLGNMLEHCGQFLTPVILIVATSRPEKWTPGLDCLVRTAVAMTFIFHGLFAIGVPAEVAVWDHTTPGHFVEMTTLCLRLESEATVMLVLRVAGILDVVAALLLLIPGRSDWLRRGQVAALAYMIVWGFLTALARPVAYLQPEEWWPSLLNRIPDFLYRTPHWGLPLVLLMVVFSRVGKK